MASPVTQSGKLAIQAASWAASAISKAAAFTAAATTPPRPPTPASPTVDIMPALVNGAENIAMLKKYPSKGGPQRIQRLIFPVNPEGYTLSQHRDSQDVALLQAGTLSRPGARTPRELTFDAFFPDPSRTPTNVTWTNLGNGDLPDPWTAVKLVRDWQNSENQVDGMTPLLLVIQDTADACTMWCMITQFDVSTKPREVGDVYFSITFKEVSSFPTIEKTQSRPGATQAASQVAALAQRTGQSVASAASSVRVDPRAPATSITTVAGDNLARISARAYHGVSDTTHINALWSANKAAIGPDKLAVIKAGLKLVVPAV